MTRDKVDGAKAASKKPAAKAAKSKASDAHGGTKVGAKGGLVAPVVKAKLVRDSFTIPKDEYLALSSLKGRAAHLRRPAKKSELLRAGIAALLSMSDRSFLAALAKVPTLKTGRPKEPTGSQADL